MRARLFVIGCTGSVGSSVLSVCRAYPDRFEVRAVAARSSVEKIEQIADEFKSSTVVLTNASAAADLAVRAGDRFSVLSGISAMEETAARSDIDHVVVASSGTEAVHALLRALREGKDVSLANKESIVAGGRWIIPHVRREGQLRPLDSEHNAVWQCLQGRDPSTVKKIYLTASGGPFRTLPAEELQNVTPEMAVAHPVWDMGAKISVDSATLMNKGIEILEAMSLFRLSPERVDAVVCPEPFIHGIVEFTDGTFIMAASAPDMKLPCASALFYPNRSPEPVFPSPVLEGKTLFFEKPDEERFPALRVAKEAALRGGAAPALLVGADEAAVDAFLSGQIGFTDIPRIVETVIEQYRGPGPGSIDDALSILAEGKRAAAEICRNTNKTLTLRRKN